MSTVTSLSLLVASPFLFALAILPEQTSLCHLPQYSTDTASWAMPAFLALALPLVTSTKVVISEMSIPLFTSGRDFQETVVFDAPHPYLDWLLRGKRIRVNQLLQTLHRMTSIYRVNIDTYADKGKPHWG